MKIGDIRVRDVIESDIPHFLNYWHNAPDGFIESMSIDPSKVMTRDEMDAGIRRTIENNAQLEQSKSTMLIIVHDSKPIGYHALFPVVENDHGCFHAHIWDAEMRGQGVAAISAPLACEAFAKRFNLAKILAKVPAQNSFAIDSLERNGIPCKGEEVISNGIVKDGTVAKVFEWRPDSR